MTVAVAYNRSPEGTAALDAATRLAARLGEDLAVLSVTEDDPDGEGAGAEQVARTEAERAVAGLDLQVGREVHVAAAGRDVAQALLDLVAASGSTMLVVGTKRRSRVGKLLMGSVVQRLVIDAPVPVLTVKPAP